MLRTFHFSVFPDNRFKLDKPVGETSGTEDTGGDLTGPPGNVCAAGGIRCSQSVRNILAAQGFERGAEFRHEKLGLFPRGKVAAFVDLVVIIMRCGLDRECRILKR